MSEIKKLQEKIVYEKPELFKHKALAEVTLDAFLMPPCTYSPSS